MTDDEDLEIRRRIFEMDARMDAQRAAQANQLAAALEQERSQLAQDRLERQAAELETYRQHAITAAVSSKVIALQFVPFIGGSSREAVDASVALAKAATAEILAEIGQQQHQEGEVPAQVPAQPTSGDQIDWEHLSLEDWARVRSQYINTTDHGIFG